MLELFKDKKYLFCLESSQCHAQRGRYSFIGFDPFDIFEAGERNPLSSLRERYGHYRLARQPLTPLPAGIVGFLSYDYGLHQEKIRRRGRNDVPLPEGVFGFYDRILTVDHWKQKLYVSSSGFPEKDPGLRKRRAARRIEEVEERIARYQPPPALPLTQGLPVDVPKSGLPLSSNFSRQQYFDAVRKALAYIERGDIYQVNLSQRFAYTPPEDFDPLQLWGLLNRYSPTDFGAYFDAGAFQIISNSPEEFLHVRDGLVRTRPMKGTRPRGADVLKDRRLYQEICGSPKDRAELLMITDLVRNDLGKVCAYGSVRVRQMRAIEEYRYVFQATSLVEGTLAEDKDCFDVIEACFPGGSITGCPKIRAMEVIEELEPARRGVYTGSLGYISFDGTMHLNILIRTLLCRGGKIYFQTGGGIVADSTPEGEYEETLVKARALQACLEQVRNHAKTGHLARR